MSGGAAVRAFLQELRGTVAAVREINDPALGATAERLSEAIESLERATDWLLAELASRPQAALAGATPYLRLFAVAAGGCALAEEALAATRTDSGHDAAGRLGIARFFAEHMAVASGGLEREVIGGAEAILDFVGEKGAAAVGNAHGAAGNPQREEVRAYYSVDVLCRLMALVSERAAEVADALGVEHLDVMPILEPSLETFYDFVHFTPAGAALVAEAVASAILAPPIALERTGSGVSLSVGAE